MKSGVGGLGMARAGERAATREWDANRPAGTMPAVAWLRFDRRAVERLGATTWPHRTATDRACPGGVMTRRRHPDPNQLSSERPHRSAVRAFATRWRWPLRTPD